ncbi:MAG: hypothetical protein RJB66_462 [Pseudomonadota bacterium]|jgi:DNA repair exonuclease SbcCD ATPase subunit
MSLNYQHEKKKHQENFWTSYADLYSTLFTIFLFIYVASTLKQGTRTLEQVQDKKYLVNQIEDLKQQLKVYEALKDNYMKKEASGEESALYDELIGKLDLLQEEAKNEKEALRRKAMENERKEKALNKYQQLIRNMINSNVIAKTKIQYRNELISEKETLIEKQNTEIATLDADVAAKRTELASKEQQLNQVSEELRQKELKLTEAKGQYDLSLADARQKFQNELNSAQNSFNEAINKERLSGAERAAREKSFRDQMSAREKAYEGQLAALKSKYDSTQGELRKAIDQINTRKKLTDQIKNRFAKNGIQIEIDEKSGEVVLDFKDSYFETGKAILKTEMIENLRRFIPLYTDGLFEDDATANKIASVEIIGFASPTYKGKYVDPSSLEASNRDAVNYNLDLSYARAKAIFTYVANTDKLQFKNQQRFMGLVKVTGRSFLAQKTDVNGAAVDDFCKVNDCKKEQKVIIKFNLKD